MDRLEDLGPFLHRNFILYQQRKHTSQEDEKVEVLSGKERPGAEETEQASMAAYPQFVARREGPDRFEGLS